jgi:hypothetical protein
LWVAACDIRCPRSRTSSVSPANRCATESIERGIRSLATYNLRSPAASAQSRDPD